MECQCLTCRKACHKRPGWFLPTEVEGAAQTMGLSLKQFFDDHLVVDYYMETEGMVFLLAPAMGDCPTGQEAPFDPNGKCIFLNSDERCSIHASKPKECAHYDHGISRDSSDRCRAEVVAAWNTPEAQQIIRDLLGRDPVLDIPTPEESLGLLLGQLFSNIGRF